MQPAGDHAGLVLGRHRRLRHRPALRQRRPDAVGRRDGPLHRAGRRRASSSSATSPSCRGARPTSSPSWRTGPAPTPSPTRPTRACSPSSRRSSAAASRTATARAGATPCRPRSASTCRTSACRASRSPRPRSRWTGRSGPSCPRPACGSRSARASGSTSTTARGPRRRRRRSSRTSSTTRTRCCSRRATRTSSRRRRTRSAPASTGPTPRAARCCRRS